MSTSYPVPRRVPQGFILSPLLFNILLSDLHASPHSHLLIYADITTIISRVPTTVQTQAHLQEVATTVETWLKTWGLKISPSESSLMCFTYKPLLTPPSVTVSGEPVPYTRTHTFLSLRLDGPWLTWCHHIEHLRTACSKQIDIMKRLTGLSWGASRELLLQYYNATI